MFELKWTNARINVSFVLFISTYLVQGICWYKTSYKESITPAIAPNFRKSNKTCLSKMAAIGTQLTESVVGSVIWTFLIEYVSILKAIMTYLLSVVVSVIWTFIWGYVTILKAIITYLLDRAIHKSKYWCDTGTFSE